MRRVPVATRTIVDEKGRERKFRYDLIVEVEETAKFCCENYGVGVLEPDGEDTVIPAITPRADRIDELLTLLVEQAVGPIAVGDVVADWL